MIAEFTVKNFYSIRSAQKLSFVATSDSYMDEEYCYKLKDGVRLLKIGIIYGSNASGKTNLLDAFSFFQDIMMYVPKDKTARIDFAPFLLDDYSRNEKTEMTMTFYLDNERYKLYISFDNCRIYSETLHVYSSVQPTLLYERTYNKETDATDITFGNKVGLPKKSRQFILGNTINNCSVIAAFGKSNVEASRLNKVYTFFSSQIKDVLYPTNSLTTYAKKNMKHDDDGSLRRFVAAFLEASDFNIEDIELRNDETIITPEIEKVIQAAPFSESRKEKMIKEGKLITSGLIFTHKTDCGTFELPEDYESRGTLRFMGLAVILKQLLTEKHFMLIDEIESSIHYELISYFIKIFLANSDNSSQLLVTTHDINLLNEDFIRRDSIWFTDKDVCGETRLVRLSSLGLHKNLSPYNAYKQGKLVKLPFLGSFYLNLNR